MLPVIKKFFDKIYKNKRDKVSFCENCTLNEGYAGPIIINSEGKNPSIMIVSESPAEFEKVEWNPNRVQELIEEYLKCPSIPNGWPGKLVPFLHKLTDGKLSLNPTSRKTNSNIYWTHTVKCFIQRSSESIKDAKKRLRENFKKACLSCCQYLLEEVEKIKPQLIVLVGKEAFRGLLKESEFEKWVNIRKQWKNIQVITVYHPCWHGQGKIKHPGYELAKDEIKKLL